MMKYGVLGTVPEGKRGYAEENTTANVNYLFVGYDQIPDSTITVDDQASKDYFNDHRYEKMWQQNQEVRSFDYIIMNFNPSSVDINEYIKKMQDIKTDFINTSNDSMFVVNYAETPVVMESPYGARPSGNYTNDPYRGGKFPAFIDEQIENANKGDVVGPFVNADKIQMVKVFAAGEEEQAKVRHILITSRENDPDEAKNKKLADSILYAIRRDSSKFSSLVTKYSEDPGSVPNGGVYSWFPKGQMVPEFNDFSFEKRIGSTGVVKTNYGFHIIQVLGRRNGSYKNIAIIDETIKVSKATQDQFYDSVALAFYYMADSADFKTAADEFGLEVKESGYVPLIYPNRRTEGFYGPKDLNRNLNVSKWAFNSEIGSIMEPEYISDKQLAIAVLTEKIHEDDDRFNNLKPLMEPMVKNHLKATNFIELNKDKVSGNISLDSIAKVLGYQLTNINVKYSDVNIGNNMQELAEPKVMAYIFSLSSNEISPIIEGKKGIYIVQTVNITEAVVDDEKATEKAKSQEDELRNMIDQNYYSSLYSAYKTKDQRAKKMILND